MPNLLFICSKNQWRSPTAELLFKNHPVHSARSAGTSDKARVKINHKMVEWADVILVMERKHRQLLERNFIELLDGKTVMVLDIEDNYQFNDPELVAMLKTILHDFL